MDLNEDSFLVYWPKIKDLGIPVPRTVIVPVTEKEYHRSFDGVPKSLTRRVQAAIDEHFELPVFLRTDQASDKHSWLTSCYYDGQQELGTHLYEIITFNHCADFMGLEFQAILVREYIPMAAGFTAFRGMPVNPERRYFIRDGAVQCHHYYWISEAVEHWHKPPSDPGWREILTKLNHESPEEIALLTGYAERVAAVLPGYWSVDFCQGADGVWWLIDMATGPNSWHPEDCEYSMKEGKS